MSSDAPKVGLPPRPFLYTMDQLSVILSLDLVTIRGYLYFEGRSTGFPTRPKMIARNIAPPNERPEWRVAEKEFVRWLKFKGFKFYDSGSVRS